VPTGKVAFGAGYSVLRPGKLAVGDSISSSVASGAL
jgi:hypothetical protein